MTCLFSRFTIGLICCAFATLVSGPVLATNVTLQTPFGDVDIELFDEDTPETVANFLNYVNDGDFANSFIHRSVPGFIIQGGGFTYINDVVEEIPKDPPVINEPGISNLRGTIAMAKVSGDPNSATSGWFINLGDNSANLDEQNGGFTVFGQVTANGMDVIDAIASLQVWERAAPFGELPLIDYPGTGDITDEYLVMTDVAVSNTFHINSGLNDAWTNTDTSGQGFFIAVYPDIEVMFLAWFTFDTERPDESVSALLGEPGHRWLTAQGKYADNKAVLDIVLSEGGIFDAATPASNPSKYGAMVVEFSDCNAGTVTYDIPSVDRQGVIPIKRVSLDNVPLCEQLAEQLADQSAD
jgi:peptidyl-prolyl cis-trans isomerase A (cyclophilin A)